MFPQNVTPIIEFFALKSAKPAFYAYRNIKRHQ
jgi:hypothetical protein